MTVLLMGDQCIVRFLQRGAWNGTYLDIFWACASDIVVGRQFELVVATREDIVEECFIGRGKPFIAGYAAPLCRL
jgi:hypothetical protein